MYLRISVIALAVMLALTTACTNKKVSNPLAKVDSKQPDKVLFDRGMDAMKHNRFDVARITMQTLIATYPDSEFVARAKLALADSWYAEGGTAALAQAEQEYKDFETFFPNMPEAAEAQLKIANIHFSQMEKPDRDFTHAMRAEQEYRAVILQYPENQKIVAQAKEKLLQVQEVIADREFRVGRFYYLRDSYAAAIARLQSLVDRYPLYSRADEALYLVGQSYEGEVSMAHRPQALAVEKKLTETQRKNLEVSRERYSTDAIAQAAAAYDKILTRYPVMESSDAAKQRLLALKQPVPRPTKAMLAQNKAEEAARHEPTTMASVMSVLSRHPDVSAATNVGEPTLQDKDLVSAKDLVAAANRAAVGGGAANSVTAGIVKDAPTENERAPRSDDPAAPATAANAGDQQPDPNELKPTADTSTTSQQAAAPDPNELTPNVPQDARPAAPPTQVNEIALDGGKNGGGANASSSQGSNQDLASDEMISSSKHKKKKGLHKIIPLS